MTPLAGMGRIAVARVARVWRRRPMLTFAVVGTMGLALAMGVAMSAVLDTVARRAVVFPNGPELVQLLDVAPGEGESGETVSVVDYAEWRQSSPLYRQLAAYSSGDGTIRWRHRAEIVSVTAASGNLLRTLGIAPDAGRLPTREDEDVVPCAAVAVRRAAVTMFGSVAAALDQSITVSGRACVLVGVVADRHAFPGPDTSIFVTSPPRGEIVGGTDGRVGVRIAQVHVLGLPRKEVSRATLEGEAHAYFRNQPRARSLQDALTVTYKDVLRTLGLASLLVLAVAMLNLSAVLVVLAVQRVREWAIKSVLGATRFHILRDVLADALVLVASGGACGLILAQAALERLRTLGPTELSEVRLRPELAVLWLVALVPVVLFNGLPAWVQASRLAILGAAQLNAAGIAAAGSVPARRLLPSVVALQLAASIALVAVCLLFLATIGGALTRDRGFEADDVVVIPTFKEASATIESYLRDVQRWRDDVPPTHGRATSLALDVPVPRLARSFSLGGQEDGRGSVLHSPAGPVRMSVVGPDFLRVMRTPMLAGRELRAEDDAQSPPVVVVSRRLASMRFGEPRSALGHAIEVPYVRGRTATIVGVAEDVRRGMWDDVDLPAIYLPLAQRDLSVPTASLALERVLVVARGAGQQSLLEALGQRAGSVALGEPWTIRQAKLQEVASTLLYAVLAVVFGVTTMLVTGLGVFAVSSDHVQRRQTEFGVRQVTGASPSLSVRPVCVAFAAWLAIAVVFGVGAGALVLPRLGVWQVDAARWSPGLLALSVALVSAVAVAGVVAPLRYVQRRQPAELLREE